MMKKHKKLKITAIILSVVAAVVIIIIQINSYNRIDVDMNFDVMRELTDEENWNNASNIGYDKPRITGNKDYICFTLPRVGIVCFDIEKNEYRVIEKSTKKQYLYDSLQIFDNNLYYLTYGYAGSLGYLHKAVWRINLDTGKKERVFEIEEDGIVWPYFHIVNDGVLYLRHDGILLKGDSKTGELQEIADKVGVFCNNDEYIYYLSNRELYRLNMNDTSKKECLNYELPNRIPVRAQMFVNDNKLFIFVQSNEYPDYYYLDAIIDGTDVQKIESNFVYNSDYRFISSPGDAIFIDNYVVTNIGIFDLNGKLLKEFNFGTTIGAHDEKVFNIIVRPLLVGGNVYLYCEDSIDLPEVGNGWYKLDIEEYLAE